MDVNAVGGQPPCLPKASGSADGLSVIVLGFDERRLAFVGCQCPPEIVAKDLDAAARSALRELAGLLGHVVMRDANVGTRWGATLDAAAREVNRCRAGEWPAVRFSPRVMAHTTNVPAYWGAWAISGALLVSVQSRRAQAQWDAASSAWNDLALAIESKAIAGKDGTAPAALWRKANRTLAALGPLALLTAPGLAPWPQEAGLAA